MKTITIVVCTHNRERYLIDCLKSLKKLSKVKDYSIRIAVIDSSDKKLNRKYQKLANKYAYDRDKKALSLKRNLAIKNIKTDFIVFTDDDCVAAKKWISELIDGFKDDNVACVTGRTVPYNGYEGTAYERKFSFDKLGAMKKVIRKHFGLQNLWRFGHGNNMAFRTDIFEQVGLFDVNLGVGSKGLRAEDVDMFYRIYKKGDDIVFNPAAIVYHKHLVQEKDIAREAFRNGYASRLVLWKHHDINCIVLYFGGIIKLSLKTILSGLLGKNLETTANLQLLKGWLGLRFWRD